MLQSTDRTLAIDDEVLHSFVKKSGFKAPSAAVKFLGRSVDESPADVAAPVLLGGRSGNGAVDVAVGSTHVIAISQSGDHGMHDRSRAINVASVNHLRVM